MNPLFSLCFKPRDLIPDMAHSVEGLQGLSKLYDRIYTETTSIIEKAGLKCPPLCGKCCNTPSSNIEVTVFEMLLPAIELWKKGEAPAIMERLEKSSSKSRCILFIPLQAPDSGRCGMYHNRALICRLFGIAGHFDKYQKIQFSPCLEIKKETPDKETEVQKMLTNGLSMPVFSLYRERVYALNPLLTEKLYPINTALRRALERVGFYLMYS